MRAGYAGSLEGDEKSNHRRDIIGVSDPPEKDSAGDGHG
jgi:hypothetical protein